ncbi:MAG: DNA-protecting protein DprA [Candidatus Omnitrophica bacterium]|nr:DNA-protecting protein DprA [Candidatus Omnitrophota bacterium]
MNRTSSDILALSMVPGLGPRRIAMLLEEADDTEDIFSMTDQRLQSVLGRAFRNKDLLRGARNSEDFAEEMEYITSRGIRLLCPGQKGYPGALREIYDPPAVLFIKGQFRPEDANAVAVVGSRRCTSYGERMARELASGLAEAGITVVSGMARGIDTASHEGALRAGGRTIAVMGSGFRHIYPPEAEELAERIAERGAVLTEYPSRQSPTRRSFPQRNRIISALCKGVVVVEAAARSGALITADFALEHGREVFAVPGRADFATSRGTNMLIQNGAKLVTRVEDILEEIRLDASAGNESSPPSLEITGQTVR